jgi:fermentation-respiration switch protein FrsA (DUF1100 family)
MFSFQKHLIFYPGKLPRNYSFSPELQGEEIFLKTADGESINALFYKGDRPEVILYFHGNAGDLSNWQFVSEEFVKLGYNFFIIDYRGYGKSSGNITEKGLYLDADAAYQFLITEKNFSPLQVLIYGRSIGSGVAVELVSKHQIKGVILEAPYISLKKLAHEKAPFLLPSLWLSFHFNNLEKINRIKCPVLFIHGDQDTLIPPSHSSNLFETFSGKKKLVMISGGSHNDLDTFSEYHKAIRAMSELFN